MEAFVTTVAPTRTQALYYSDQNTINGEAYDPTAPPQFYAQLRSSCETLFTGTAGTWTLASGASYVGGALVLVSPLGANSRVYVPLDGGVAVFGLNP